MQQLYTIAEVCVRMGWSVTGSKHYQRLRSAVMLGEAGQCVRHGRGWVLTEKNVEKLMVFIKKRWPDSFQVGSPDCYQNVKKEVNGAIQVG